MTIDKARNAFAAAEREYHDAWFENTSLTNSSIQHMVEEFGRKWVVPREGFLCTAVLCIIATVHTFVMALFETGFALVEGKGKNFTLNNKAIEDWKNTGKCILLTLESFVGFFSPEVAIKVHRFIEEKMFPKSVS